VSGWRYADQPTIGKAEVSAQQMLANIQAVVFDLDGTLLDRRRSFERFIRDQWERFADVVRKIAQEEYVQILIELDRDGYAPRKELFTGLIAQFELPSGLAETLLNDYRAGFPSACVLFPDAAQTLSSLRAAGLKLGLITNGSVRMQSRKLECLALSARFDTILIFRCRGHQQTRPPDFSPCIGALTSLTSSKHPKSSKRQSG
jgi:putative hydrolase of the HAD superfamily